MGQIVPVVKGACRPPRPQGDAAARRATGWGHGARGWQVCARPL